MSDLSWLNPTPHAIAVYASQPLSPVATQHSLPSGRYSLLGPDFHRLDRTSLRLAHSFNHLVSDAEQRGRECNAERLGGYQVHDQIEFGRLLDRDITRLRAAKNLIDIVAGTPEKGRAVGSIGHQTCFSGGVPSPEHRRQPRAQGQCVDANSVGVRDRIGNDIKRLRATLER